MEKLKLRFISKQKDSNKIYNRKEAIWKEIDTGVIYKSTYGKIINILNPIKGEEFEIIVSKILGNRIMFPREIYGLNNDKK